MYLFIFLFLGLIPAYIANKKGYDFFTWYVYGCVFFVIALFHAYVIPAKKQLTAEEKLEQKKKHQKSMQFAVIPVFMFLGLLAFFVWKIAF